VGMKRFRFPVGLLAAVLLGFGWGCTVPIDDSGNGDPDDGGQNGGGTGDAGRLRVSFDAEGGNLAAGVDDNGNQYAFRARESDGSGTDLTEATIRTTDGRTLKVSLDPLGRPVNFRASDNTAADLVYDADTVRVRLTAPDGSLIADEQGLDAAAAHEQMMTRRTARGAPVAETRQFLDVSIIADGLGDYAEIALSIFDEEFNPGSALVSSSLAEAALLLGELAVNVEIVEVERAEIATLIVIDETPPVIRALAGQTYVLYDSDGFCLEATDIESRLTFDNDGILLSEFDRHLVFPTFSLGGSGDPGVTINYLTGAPINLNPDDASGVTVLVTPIYVSTLVDEFGNITVERRFRSDVFADTSPSGFTSVFEAAFVHGRLLEGGDILEFDLSLIDLMDLGAVPRLGTLRYHNQNVSRPATETSCEIIVGDREPSRIVCPAFVAAGDAFDVAFVPGREDAARALELTWFISDGYGVVLGGGFPDENRILTTAEGFLEVALLVTDRSGDDLASGVYTCGVSVGRILDEIEAIDELVMTCPSGLNVGETGVVSVAGPLLSGLAEFNWFVFGTGDFTFAAPFDTISEIEVYEPGKFEVAFQAFDGFGSEVFVSCEILVGGVYFDECEREGFYGDGICDEFCPEPDPDCDEFFDICEINGWYGDDECDDFCPEPDPDCDVIFEDICADNGYYGDDECDLFCPLPDPDCDETFDVCLENGWYGDGVCDEVCPVPDPDCG